MNPRKTQNNQTFQNLLHPTHNIGQLLGRCPLVQGPGGEKWNDKAPADNITKRRRHIERLQAAHAKWPQWLRGGRGLTEAELDACKELASMSPEERGRILRIHFAPE